MKKILLTLLLAIPVSGYASDRIGFEYINAKSIAESIPSVQVPMPGSPVYAEKQELSIPEVKPPLKELKASDYYFNSYILKAVEYLKKNYGLKGYNIKAVLTHDINYGTYGTIKATKPPQTMCVAAAMETMLTAYQIYLNETGDYTPYNYLPKSSYERLGIGDLKGHIWVNHSFNSWGTADALTNFGMGVKVKFENLQPGSFVNINRTTKTGHAVVFISYLNSDGREQYYYNDKVIGFKYFSSQGGAEAGKGGFDYRYAIFSKFGCPNLNSTIKRDCNVIYSENQNYLNTGMMLSPKYWTGVKPDANQAAGFSVFDGNYFNGVTTDDNL